MHPPAYDQPGPWYIRLRRVIRVLRVVRNLTNSLWLVALGVVLGGFAGALMGAKWNTDTAFWAGLAAGGVLGAAAAGVAAKRIFFSEPHLEHQEPLPIEPTPGAPRWPGVEEQFQKILRRLRVLFVALIAPFLLLCYLKLADETGWPVPAWIPATALTWGSLGLVVAAAGLMLLLIRCPKCGGILWNAAKLYECPHCGIVLRG